MEQNCQRIFKGFLLLAAHNQIYNIIFTVPIESKINHILSNDQVLLKYLGA